MSASSRRAVRRRPAQAPHDLHRDRQLERGRRGEPCPCVPGGAAAGDQVLHVDARDARELSCQLPDGASERRVFDRGCGRGAAARGQPEDRADRRPRCVCDPPRRRRRGAACVAARKHGLQRTRLPWTTLTALRSPSTSRITYSVPPGRPRQRYRRTPGTPPAARSWACRRGAWLAAAPEHQATRIMTRATASAHQATAIARSAPSGP